VSSCARFFSDDPHRGFTVGFSGDKEAKGQAMDNYVLINDDDEFYGKRDSPVPDLKHAKFFDEPPYDLADGAEGWWIVGMKLVLHRENRQESKAMTVRRLLALAGRSCAYHNEVQEMMSA